MVYIISIDDFIINNPKNQRNNSIKITIMVPDVSNLILNDFNSRLKATNF